MMQKQSEDDHTKIEDDWGNPPSPDTPKQEKGNQSSNNSRYRMLNWYFTSRNHVLA